MFDQMKKFKLNLPRMARLRGKIETQLGGKAQSNQREKYDSRPPQVPNAHHYMGDDSEQTASTTSSRRNRRTEGGENHGHNDEEAKHREREERRKRREKRRQEEEAKSRGKMEMEKLAAKVERLNQNKESRKKEAKIKDRIAKETATMEDAVTEAENWEFMAMDASDRETRARFRKDWKEVEVEREAAALAWAEVDAWTNAAQKASDKIANFVGKFEANAEERYLAWDCNYKKR